MKQGKIVSIHEAAALVGCLPQTLAYRALVAGQRVYRISLTTVPEERS